VEGVIGVTLEGRRAVVTGGTRGIGAAIARQLTGAGADVLAIGVSKTATAPEGVRLELVDLKDPESVSGLAERLAQSPVDILVNNAGINVVAGFADIRPEDFDDIHQINVRAPLVLMQAVVPGMRRRKWGRIVNVTSIFGHVSRAGRGAYSASKFGLDGMTTALAAEVAGDGVLANCVAPGFVDTDLTRRVLGQEGIDAVAATVPIGRLAKPDEIARFVVWLASESNTYISGQNLLIDGGVTRV